MSVLRIDHAWKRLARRAQVRTLAELLYGLPRRMLTPRDADGLREHEFWALRELDLALERGETLGVIGPNGAGKSTILKLIARIMRPDRGSVTVQGRVTGLIELGAGFHPMLSGRENVFINGAIHGMKRRDIRSKFDSIVEFAGLGEFMDMPVKNYSSGMYARLAFAIAAHAQPDLLLVDEVLAVGDASFQARCYDWIEQRRREGCAIVLVSHHMAVVQATTRCLYLRDGRAVMLDSPRTVIDRYLADQAQIIKDSASVAPDHQGITSVELLGPSGEPVYEIQAGAPAVFRVHYNLGESVAAPGVTLELLHSDPRFPISTPGGSLACLDSGDALGGTVQGRGAFTVRVAGLHLPVGMYSVNAAVKSAGALTAGIRRDEALRFEVTRPAGSTAYALIELQQQWQGG